MAKTITVDDIRINSIRIERDDANNITITTDYHWKESGNVIPGINLQVSTFQDALANLDPALRDALIELNTVEETRIKAEEGI